MKRYHWGLVTLHWLTALLVIVVLAFGTFILTEIEIEADRLSALRAHMSIGIVILVLMLVRVIFRYKTEKPPPSDIGVRLVNILARLAHTLLYVVVILMAASGIGTALQAGLFDIIFAGNDAPIPDDLMVFRPRIAHGVLAKLLIALVVLHITAALYHQFVRKDGLLGRMWYGGP